MSQYLCSSLGNKNYLTSSDSEQNSIHSSLFWPRRSFLSSSSRSPKISSWSYPPKSTNFCSKFFSGISEKIANYCPNHKRNPNCKFNRSHNIEDLFSTRVLKRMGNKMKDKLVVDFAHNMTECDSECLPFPSSSTLAERTAVSSDDERNSTFSINDCDTTNDSDTSSSNFEKSGKMQICDSNVVQSMQNDRQKRKKRKRRRRKRKINKNVWSNASSNACSALPASSHSTKQVNDCKSSCFSMFTRPVCHNEIMSIIIDGNDDNYSTDGCLDSELSSDDEELTRIVDIIAPDLELMCKSLFFDCVFSSKPKNECNTHHTVNGIDEIDCTAKRSSYDVDNCFLNEDENEMNSAIVESLKKANETWDSCYATEPSEDKSPSKVNFSSDKPTVLILHVWDYALRQARCGQWEEIGRDRRRFADRCRRINEDIGYIFQRHHREKIFSERFN